MSSESPCQMTAHQRTREISGLFAEAMLHLHQQTALKLNIPLKQSANRVEAVSKTRLNGHQSG